MQQIRCNRRQIAINSVLLLWLKDHINAVALTLSLMFQLILLCLKKVVVHRLVLCMQEPIGVTALIKESRVCLPRILSTMMLLFKDVQQKIMLT